MWEDSCLGLMIELQFNGGLWSWDDVAGTSQLQEGICTFMSIHRLSLMGSLPGAVPGSGFTRYWITEGFKRSMG